MLTNKRRSNPPEQPATIFVVNKFSEKDLTNAFPSQYQIVENGRSEGAWQLLDTFDQQLRTAHQLLFRQGENLVLFQLDKGLVRQTGCPESWTFVNELPVGPVESCLRSVNPLRACLPLTEIKLNQSDYQILDDQRKTVCRFRSIGFHLSHGQALTVIEVDGLRGYNKELRMVKSVLAQQGTMALAQSEQSIWSVLYPDLTTVSKKHDFSIDPHASAIQVKIDLIGFYLATARANEAGIIADWDTEFLHDYRVSLRKVRSVLSLFKNVFSDDVTRSLKSAFADIMKTTNLLRDLDVYLLDKPDYLMLVPKAMRPGLIKMFAEFSRERKKQLNMVKQKLLSEEYLNAMDLLQQQFPPYADKRIRPKVSTPSGPQAEREVGDYANVLIYKRYRKIRKLARSVSDNTPDGEIHELRIEFKKIRYLMEFFATLYPADELKGLLKAMKNLQSSLGRFNDLSVQQLSLNAVVDLQQKGRRKADMDIVRSIGALVAALNSKQLEARHQIVVNLDDFISKPTRMTFDRVFHAAAADGQSQEDGVNNADSIAENSLKTASKKGPVK